MGSREWNGIATQGALVLEYRKSNAGEKGQIYTKAKMQQRRDKHISKKDKTITS